MRHDEVAVTLYNTIIQTHFPEQWYTLPQAMWKWGHLELWWDTHISTAPRVKHNKPDIVVWDDTHKKCTIIDICVALESWHLHTAHRRTTVPIPWVLLWDSSHCRWCNWTGNGLSGQKHEKDLELERNRCDSYQAAAESSDWLHEGSKVCSFDETELTTPYFDVNYSVNVKLSSPCNEGNAGAWIQGFPHNYVLWEI